MIKLLDKLILFVICGGLYLSNTDPGTQVVPLVVPLLIVVILSAAASYFDEDRISAGIFVLFMVLCVFEPSFTLFVPLLCYDVILTHYKALFLLGLLPVVVHYSQYQFVICFLVVMFIMIAYILKHRTVSLMKLRIEYYRLLDTSKEASMLLESQNKALMENQDYEISLATLNERNRIARDIHDNVGHLLSRSILQIGALLATVKDDSPRENIGLLKETLSQAMDSIRNSVHDLHEESFDLRVEIESLIRAFTFCPVQLEYDVEFAPDKDTKYCFLAVTKEALNNITRHSDATQATITVREHPALYQLVIRDNGSTAGVRGSSRDNETGNSGGSGGGRFGGSGGIGLRNIADRVAALNGNLNISADGGFRIFISIPKAQSQRKDGNT